MARQRKSINDIWDQYNRIRALGNGNGRRVERANDIATRYGRSIQGSAGWQRAFAQGQADYKRNNSGESYLRDFDLNAKTAGYGKADNKKFSRNVYMGIANNAG